MSAQTGATELPDDAISEWKPSGVTIWAWVILSIPLLWFGVGIYLASATHGASHVEGTIKSGEILVELLIAAALTLALACIHEAVHGLPMIAFGAKPQFGILRYGGVPMGLYATSPGHRFTRRQYLIVCLAPLAILSPLGVALCWLPFGGYLVVPFAAQFAGCIGDITITWHVLRAPAGAACEDMRDGTRFWKAEA
jgi:hypothetical protein